MIIVVDTNIIFSGLLNSDGFIGDILLNSGDSFEFYTPTIAMDELLRHKAKLLKLSGYTQNQFEFLLRVFFKEIQLIDLESINSDSLEKAEMLTHDVDIFDKPFVALSLELNAPLWTGDKKLVNGLNSKNFQLLISSKELNKLRA